MRKAGSVLFIAALVFLSTLNLLSFSAIGGPLTSVTMDLEYQETEVDVSPGSTGVTSATIKVTCQTFDPTPVSVQLSTECTVGSATLSPAEIVFQTIGNETREVNIDIIVPLLTPASEDETCTVTGTWTQGIFSGPVEPVTIQLIIMPFFHLDLTCSSPINGTIPGESTYFTLRIENSGNCDDEYKVEIANRDELEAENITIKAVDKIAVGKGGSEEIEVNVSTSSETPVKNYTVHVVVTSKGSEMESENIVEEKVILLLVVKERILVTKKVNTLEIDTDLLVLFIIADIIIVGVVAYIRRRRGQKSAAYES